MVLTFAKILVTGGGLVGMQMLHVEPQSGDDA